MLGLAGRAVVGYRPGALLAALTATAWCMAPFSCRGEGAVRPVAAVLTRAAFARGPSGK